MNREGLEGEGGGVQSGRKEAKARGPGCSGAPLQVLSGASEQQESSRCLRKHQALQGHL